MLGGLNRWSSRRVWNSWDTGRQLDRAEPRWTKVIDTPRCGKIEAVMQCERYWGRGCSGQIFASVSPAGRKTWASRPIYIPLGVGRTTRDRHARNKIDRMLDRLAKLCGG